MKLSFLLSSINHSAVFYSLAPLWPYVSCELSGRVTGAWMGEVGSGPGVSGQSHRGVLGGHSQSDHCVAPQEAEPWLCLRCSVVLISGSFLLFATFFFFLMKMYGEKEHTPLFRFQSTKLYFCYFTFTYRQLCHWFSFRTRPFGFCTCIFLLFWYFLISLKSSIFLSCENTVSTTQQVLEQNKILILNPGVL